MHIDLFRNACMYRPRGRYMAHTSTLLYTEDSPTDTIRGTAHPASSPPALLPRRAGQAADRAGVAADGLVHGAAVPLPAIRPPCTVLMDILTTTASRLAVKQLQPAPHRLSPLAVAHHPWELTSALSPPFLPVFTPPSWTPWWPPTPPLTPPCARLWRRCSRTLRRRRASACRAWALR